MASLGQILSRTLFWSYERGTWQYDLAVILILVFVLLTPRDWFHDKPQSGAPVTPGQVQLISKEGNRLKYRVDARILAPPTKLALQNDLHTALQEALPELCPPVHPDGRFRLGLPVLARSRSQRRRRAQPPAS